MSIIFRILIIGLMICCLSLIDFSSARAQSTSEESKLQPVIYLTAPFAVVGVNYQMNEKWGLRPMTSIVFESEFNDASYNVKLDATYKPDDTRSKYFIVGAYGNYSNFVENTFLNLGIGWDLEVGEKLHIRPEFVLLTDFEYFYLHTSGVAFQFQF